MRKAAFISSGLAGIFIVTQFILIFFFSIPGLLILRIMGYCLWGLCIILGCAPVYTFRKYGAVPKGQNYMLTEKLVTQGIFAIVRHPQFLCMPLMPVALTLISQHWIVITIDVPALVLGIISIQGADEGGIEKFGDEYREYMKRVPGFNIILGFWKFLLGKIRGR
jgi:protein-S-isoprenylcysteine O-methyltransferase Ste14